MHHRYNTIDIFLPVEHGNIFFVSALENELKQYQLENLTLKQQLNELETENKLKDRLLDEKSKRILNVTSQNLRFKHQIKALKKQLRVSNAKRQSVSLNKKRRKKLGKRIKHKNNKLQKAFTFDEMDLVSTPIDDTIQMPYLISTISKSVSAMSESSISSEQACKLSFPKTPQDSNPPPCPKPTNKHFLSPIAESNCHVPDLDDQTTVALTISDNNTNIEHDEWNDFMAAISPRELCILEDYAESSSISLSDDDSDTTDSFDDSMEMDTYTVSISYMSDNTVLLMDMNFNENNKLQSYIPSNSDNELPEKSLTITKMQNETSYDQLSGCDTIIQSPVVNLLEPKNLSILNSNILGLPMFTFVNVETKVNECNMVVTFK